MAPLSLVRQPAPGLVHSSFRNSASLSKHRSVRCNVGPRTPPQPAPLPLGIGNAHQLDFNQIFISIEDLHKSMGTKVLKLSFFGQTVYCVRDPELIQEVLVQRNDKYTKPDTKKRLERWFGEGIVLQTDINKHAAMKNLLSPAFRTEYLKTMFAAMAAAAQNFAEKLALATKESSIVVEMEDALHCLTLDILGLTTFDYDFKAIDGLRLGSLGPSQNEGFNVLQAHKDVVKAGMMLALGMPLPNFLVPGYVKYVSGLEKLDAAVESIVSSRTKAGPEAWAQAKDVTAFLLRAQQESGGTSPDDKQIRDEIISLLFAGSETTAQTLSFLFYALATHPEAADRARKEAQAFTASNKDINAITMDDIKSLNFITACINETLRLWPVAVDSPRIALEEDILGDFYVPAGTRVFLNQYSLHRHEQYWPKYDEFLPERFLPEGQELGPRHPHAYIPFGAGARSCIGRNFAMMSMQIAAAYILSSVEFDFPAELGPLKLSQAMSMKADGGMKLKLSPSQK